MSAYNYVNLHLEHVRPDRESQQVRGYTGLRDGYSQIGVNLRHAFGEEHRLELHLFTPVDLANMKVQDTFAHDADTPQYEAFWKASFGEIQAGYIYLPYYNAIASTTDHFTSYYTGFATYSAFRVGDSAAYISPNFYGLTLGASITKDQGYDGDNLITTSLSWKNKSTTISVAQQDLQGTQDTKVWGASLTHRFDDALLLGIKTEVFDSEIQAGYGNDGDRSTGVFASYDTGKHTLKAMLANTDNYGETSYSLGWDYRYNDVATFYAEYYSEQETAAITAEGAGSEVFDSSISGGNASVIGIALYYEW